MQESGACSPLEATMCKSSHITSVTVTNYWPATAKHPMAKTSRKL